MGLCCIHVFVACLYSPPVTSVQSSLSQRVQALMPLPHTHTHHGNTATLQTLCAFLDNKTLCSVFAQNLSLGTNSCSNVSLQSSIIVAKFISVITRLVIVILLGVL